MARSSIKVTYKEVDTARVPDALTEGATWLMLLGSRGVVEAVGKRLHIRRQGGFSGLDVLLGLLVFFTTGAVDGLRPFWERHGSHLKRIAALAGRRGLPSPASLSRALGSVEVELLRGDGTADWLLAGACGVDSLLGHPAVQSYDAVGLGWHVFDLDPTVTTLRHRALPEDDDELPEPRRRSQDTGAPGHSGRKRGDLQFRRITVQHAGSGAWLHAHLSPGNGLGMADFEQALDAVVATRERLTMSRLLLRMDGEYGNVPWYSACRAREVPFITRLNRPRLYEDPEVLERLRSAAWYQVPSSGTEPRRAAADIGMCVIHPAKRTRRPDGSAYEPVTVRVVASIFPKTGEAKRGATLDGWQVELFAADLPAEPWPAADVIALYFGRAAQENRFAQEDREVGLDRIISYHLPGQEFATLAGLALWNLRLARGFELDPPPVARPVTRMRQMKVDDRVSEYWPRDPVLIETLKRIEFPVLLAKRPEWTFDPNTGELRCPEGRPLTLTSVRPAEHAPERTSIIFRRKAGGCEECPSRPACLHTARDTAVKHVELAIPIAVAEQLRTRLNLIRAPRVATIGPVDNTAGPRAVQHALFLPASARQVFAALFRDATLRVEVRRPPPEPERPRLVARDDAERRRRRKTWDQNVERYALPAETQVSIEVAGSIDLRGLLGQAHRSHTPASVRR
jgi:hypothetical protein